eukprot:4502893-Prymnesium_polylepis.1
MSRVKLPFISSLHISTYYWTLRSQRRGWGPQRTGPDRTRLGTDTSAISSSALACPASHVACSVSLRTAR